MGVKEGELSEHQKSSMLNLNRITREYIDDQITVDKRLKLTQN